MQYIGNITVVSELPNELRRLNDLAYNLYFSWRPEARQLFRLIDPDLWTRLNHNPVKFLREVQQKKLQRVASDESYLKSYKKIVAEFDSYMKARKTWFSENYPADKSKSIAYFSAEFGFHESLPIYSGGLGVLAGDHIKSASDLGIPLVGVSLFYHQTYFTQQIDANGNQIALYIPQSGDQLSLQPVFGKNGERLRVSVDVAQRNVAIQAWEVQVGRVSIYLLDTNLPENAPEDRLITSKLYGGDQEMRISQEIVLGMGGVKVLNGLGIEPAAWHMNEGHSVFLALERIRDLIRRENMSFYEALEAVSASTIFTTHTPVPAGNDAFPLHFMDKYFQRYWESIGIRRYQFMELGSQVQPEGYEIFNLTILSLKLSKYRNGVSALHGDVSRKMWKDVWAGVPTNEIPIKHVTNGVHSHTWTIYQMQQLFDKHIGKEWPLKVDEPDFWKDVYDIPDQELWDTKMAVKENMLDHLRARLEAQHMRNKVGTLKVQRLKAMLKPEILTIGFARRFATYKRATLIFRDKERLRRILSNPERPVQLIFSGKAHPKDKGGQDLIRQIHNISMEDGFRGRLFFIENYDMSLARDLISGVDVWLNNPRRPQEASGTSGQKVGMNGGVNFSVLDGWWCEGYDGKNGFAFGDREDYGNLEELDSWDSDAIYDILENDLLPAYYGRAENGLPSEWLKMMKHSIFTVMTQFNTHRMVKDYVRDMYVPAIHQGEKFADAGYKIARSFSDWRERMESNWSHIDVRLHHDSATSGADIQLRYEEALKLTVALAPGEIKPEELKVQVFLAPVAGIAYEESDSEVVDMKPIGQDESGPYLYQAEITPNDSGMYRYAVRVVPTHKELSADVELGLVTWLSM